MNRKRLITLNLFWFVAIILGLTVQSFANNESETIIKAEQHFEKAIELRKATNYDGAITEYQKVISLSPHSEIAQNAQYWIGQSHFEARQFDAALSAFQGLLETYPSSSIAPSTTQMIARAEQAKKNRALFEAVKEGDIEQVTLLISAGANIHEKDPDGELALYLAARNGHKDVVALLIEKGADINA